MSRRTQAAAVRWTSVAAFEVYISIWDSHAVFKASVARVLHHAQQTHHGRQIVELLGGVEGR